MKSVEIYFKKTRERSQRRKLDTLTDVGFIKWCGLTGLKISAET